MIHAAADYAEGKVVPPPFVEAAVMYGDADGTEWLEMPAGTAYRLRVVHNAYHAMRGYLDAGAQGQAVAWTKQRPRQWQLVSSIIAERKKKKATNG